MKKIFLLMLAGFLLMSNISISYAAKVPIHDSCSAQDMFNQMMNDIQDELDEDSFPYVIKNFRFGDDLDGEMKKTLDLPNKAFKAYACDIASINSQSNAGMVIFVVDERDKIFSVLVSASVNESMNEEQQLELMNMLMLTSGLIFHSIMSEEEMDLLVDDITNNTDKGQWGIWHGKKYINFSIGKDDDVFIFMIDATDGK